jgi:hypothetical protein
LFSPYKFTNSSGSGTFTQQQNLNSGWLMVGALIFALLAAGAAYGVKKKMSSNK